jgi:hypothetical protein
MSPVSGKTAKTMPSDDRKAEKRATPTRRPTASNGPQGEVGVLGFVREPGALDHVLDNWSADAFCGGARSMPTTSPQHAEAAPGCVDVVPNRSLPGCAIDLAGLVVAINSAIARLVLVIQHYECRAVGPIQETADEHDDVQERTPRRIGKEIESPNLLEEIALRQVRIEQMLVALSQQGGIRREVKEWFSPSEAAEVLGKRPYTVREWCRLRRINARKRPVGRGEAEEWEISTQEIDRFRNHGLLPIPSKY